MARTSARAGGRPWDIADLAPRGLQVRKLRLSGLELAVLSFPLPCLRMPANLTAAEREVAVAMASGRSNAEIARERGTSVRTVANQAQRVFRKLGVASRQELATLLYGKGPGASRDPTG